MDGDRRRDRSMTIKRAKEIVLGSSSGRLGETSKMPGLSFGISAFHCRRGRELAKDPNTPCAHCYAQTAFYKTWEPLVLGHKRRMKGLKHPLWVPAMVMLIVRYTKPNDPYFRWHDSGDLMGIWHLRNIVEVCRLTPEVWYWMPTHEPFIVLEYLELVRKGEAPEIPPNLRIRISADIIGEPPARIEGLEGILTSTTHRGHGEHRVVQVSDNPADSFECKAYLNGQRATDAGFCGDHCRACWEDVKNVSYGIHGTARNRKTQLKLDLGLPELPNPKHRLRVIQ